MTIDQLLDALDAPADRNSALELLESVVVDQDDRLIRRLVEIISEPNSVQNTNRFASLLSDLGAEAFVEPLIVCIGSATPGQSTWLRDYMYALGSLLMDREKPYPADEAFVHRLGDWLFSTRGGEISWKAGAILAELQHPATRSYLVRGVSDTALFHQTRLACLQGLVNHYREDAAQVLPALLEDPEEPVREAASDAQRHLRNLKQEA